MTEFDTDVLAQASDVARRARLALKPPPRMTLSEWADAKYYLSADAGAAEPGRWKTAPFQRGWMDAMTNPRTWQVSVMKSARVGWTESVKALIGYHSEHDPCPMLVIQPTEDDAKGFSKESIEPLLRDCPSVGERYATYALKNTMLLKRFRGGVLQLAGARSPGNFRRVSRRVVAGDEIDGYAISAGKEGNPIELASKRAESFWNRVLVWGSTPGLTGVSNIERLFLDGDQRRYYVPCPHCGAMQVLQFAQFRWPKGQPELTVYICLHCEREIDHAHKRAMVEAGEWRPGPHAQFPDVPPPAPFHGHASFHIWSAYSFLPNTTWGHIAAKFVAANAAGPEQLKTVVNTWFGETWAEKGDAPDWRRLYDRRESYAIGTCPRGVLFLTASVDVQPNRLIYEVVGWGRGKESWSIEADVVPGDTSDLSTKGPWAQVDALLDRTFRHACGAELRIRMLAIDSGDQTQTVYNYARAKGASRVMAVKGHDGADTLVATPTTVDVAVNGKRVGSLLLWKVSTPISKSELYGWLSLQLPTDEERAAGGTTPPGYCHFPEYGEEYFKQLTAEQLVTKKDQQGFPYHVWEIIPGRENHWMDCRRYARAAANRVRIDRFSEANWLELEQALVAIAPQTPEPPPEPEDGGGTPPALAQQLPTKTRPPRTARSRYLSRG